MICEQCGAEIPSGLSDCDVCGAHNDDTAQTGAMPANGIAPKSSPSGELSGESQNDTLTPTGFGLLYAVRQANAARSAIL